MSHKKELQTNTSRKPWSGKGDYGLSTKQNATRGQVWSSPKTSLSFCLTDRLEEPVAHSVPEFLEIFEE